MSGIQIRHVPAERAVPVPEVVPVVALFDQVNLVDVAANGTCVRPIIRI